MELLSCWNDIAQQRIQPVVTRPMYHGSHAVLPRMPNDPLQIPTVCQCREPVLLMLVAQSIGGDHEERADVWSCQE